MMLEFGRERAKVVHPATPNIDPSMARGKRGLGSLGYHSMSHYEGEPNANHAAQMFPTFWSELRPAALQQQHASLCVCRSR